MGAHTKLDRRGEQAAALFAERRGARLLARNWRGGGGELDLVLDDAGTIVFVEVKTRASETCGSAFEAVTRAKQRKITGAALAFLQEHALAGRPCRFDVLAVLPQGETCEVRWLANAFEAAPEEELA